MTDKAETLKLGVQLEPILPQGSRKLQILRVVEFSGKRLEEEIRKRKCIVGSKREILKFL